MSLQGLFDLLQSVPAYRRLVDEVGVGVADVVSLPEAAKPYLLGTLWRELGRPMLVVCPQPEDARRMVEQLTAYCGEELPIHHFAESEVLPYERLVPDSLTVHQRLSALSALRQQGSDAADTRAPLVVVSSVGLMQRTLSRRCWTT